MNMFLDYILPNLIEYLNTAYEVLLVIALVVFTFVSYRYYKHKRI